VGAAWKIDQQSARVKYWKLKKANNCRVGSELVARKLCCF
jgi:hypothetical protein